MGTRKDTQLNFDHYHDLFFKLPEYNDVVNGLINLAIYFDAHPDWIDTTQEEKHAILVQTVSEIVQSLDGYVDTCDTCEAFLLPIVVTDDGFRRYWCKDCQRYQKYDQRGLRY